MRKILILLALTLPIAVLPGLASEGLDFGAPVAADDASSRLAGDWTDILAPIETSRGMAALGVAALLGVAIDRLRSGPGPRRKRRSWVAR